MKYIILDHYNLTYKYYLKSLTGTGSEGLIGADFGAGTN